MHITSFDIKYISTTNCYAYLCMYPMQTCIHTSVQFSHSVASNSLPPQASLFITNSRSLLKLMSIESVMPSNHLILCRPLLLLPSIFPSIRVFSNESALCFYITYFSDCFMKHFNSSHFYR